MLGDTELKKVMDWLIKCTSTKLQNSWTNTIYMALVGSREDRAMYTSISETVMSLRVDAGTCNSSSGGRMKEL